MEKTYIAIDLKSFYASVECVARGLDPLDTNLVVADMSRTDKTICLAVSPSLKSFGIPGRPRLYEVNQKVNEVNRLRMNRAPASRLIGKSVFLHELEKDRGLAVDFIVAAPQMAKYLEFSTDIYNIYQKYFSSEDIHVYSIDEVFIDATAYLKTYNMSAHDLTLKIIRDVMYKTGVTATAGIGTNLYLAKVAMDIVAKHIPADKDGVRIASLDERSYREKLWSHTPISDFWRIGRGISKRLANHGLYTMGDIARFSLKHDGILYDEFGINAELIIDHAWGYEPCEMKDIKMYKPQNNSLSSGLVLMEPYSYKKTKVVIKEMVDNMALDLVEKHLVTNHVSLMINYDTSNNLNNYSGEITKNYYGKDVAKPTGGSISLNEYTSSGRVLSEAILEIYEQTVNKNLMVRRINIGADSVIPKSDSDRVVVKQYSIFSDIEKEEREYIKQKEVLEKENNLQEAIINIRNRFGKNSILKGTNYEEGATGKQRNEQIGGHKS